MTVFIPEWVLGYISGFFTLPIVAVIFHYAKKIKKDHSSKKLRGKISIDKREKAGKQ